MAEADSQTARPGIQLPVRWSSQEDEGGKSHDRVTTPREFPISMLANGCDGYLPTPEQHALGGYETWRTTSSYLEVEASRKITTAFVEMLTEVSQPR